MNKSVANYFTVTASNSGQAFLSTFNFKSNLDSSYTNYIWKFGDGLKTYSNGSVSKIFNFPGDYTVTMIAEQDDGTSVTDTISLHITYPVIDNMIFSSLPDGFNSYPGNVTNTPFTISLTSTQTEVPISITLQAINSKSVPYETVKDKQWENIIPTWRFLDINQKPIIGSLPVVTKPIYRIDDQGVQQKVAVEGSVSFYYVDDSATDHDEEGTSPVLLVAQTDTNNFIYPLESQYFSYKSYSNNLTQKAAILWNIEKVIPTNLVITENSLSDIYPVKWQNIPIPVLVSCQFNANLNNNFANVNSLSTILLDYPNSNLDGNLYPVFITLSSDQTNVDATYYYVEKPALYFSSYDKENNITSGYLYTTITSLSPIEGNVVITAQTNPVYYEEIVRVSQNKFSYPYNYPIVNNSFFSQQNSNILNKVNITNYSPDDSNINYYKNLGVLVYGTLNEIATPYNNGFYSINYNPLLNTVYMTDSASSQIYSYDLTANTYSSLALLSSTSADVLPLSLTIDGNNTVWSLSLSSGNLISINSGLTYQTNVVNLSNSAPFYYSVLEADINNNIWIGGASLSGSVLYYYNTSLKTLTRAQYFNAGSIPFSFTIDGFNTLWVACSGTTNIQRYNANCNIVNEYGLPNNPYSVACDRNNIIWITHGYNYFSAYDSITNNLSTWKFDNNTNSVISVSQYDSVKRKNVFTEVISTNNQYNTIWGNLTIDVYNRASIINRTNNSVLSFNISNPTNVEITYLHPLNNSSSTLINTGDNNGNKYYQKYTTPATILNLNGVSAPFVINALADSYTVAKVNEEFDMSGYYKSLALPESLQTCDLFFNNFLKAVVGDGDVNSQSLGRVTYEKIANFFSSHGDYQTADIDKLLSYAKALDVEANEYQLDAPVDIQRLLDIFSVPKNLLRGQINYDTLPVDNIQNQLTTTSLVTAGTTLLSLDRQYISYRLIQVAPLDTGETVYTADNLNVLGFRTPLFDNYNFYLYTPQQDTNKPYRNNIINWSSNETNIDYNISTNEEWYGDAGLVETMFNKVLTENLITQNTETISLPVSSLTYLGIPILYGDDNVSVENVV